MVLFDETGSIDSRTKGLNFPLSKGGPAERNPASVNTKATPHTMHMVMTCTTLSSWLSENLDLLARVLVPVQ